MLIPPQAPLHEALQPLREDLSLLQKGVEMKYVEDGKTSKVVVKAAISCIVADHIQACELCRHIGVNATMNCRACWVDKEHRADHTLSVLEHHTTRTRAQTDMVVEQVRKLLQVKNNPSRMKRFQTLSGIRTVDCIFKGVEVDPHTQCFPDPDHFLDLGLLVRFFDYANSILSNQQKEEVHMRFNSLDSKRGWNRIAINLHSTSKKMQPMTYMRKLAVLCLYLYRGLLDESLTKLLVDLLHLRAAIFARSQNESSIKNVMHLPVEIH